MKLGRRRLKPEGVLYSTRVWAATAHLSLCFTAAPPLSSIKPQSCVTINEFVPAFPNELNKLD